MVSIPALWLPILLSAVPIFIVSAALGLGLEDLQARSDYKQLPDEANLLATLRVASLKRGLYTFPYCTHQNMKSPEMAEKFKQGPVGMLTVMPSGPPMMAKFLSQWFVYCIIIGIFVAYLTGRTLPPGVAHRSVFHLAGATAFLAYGVGQLSSGIWRGQLWGMTAKEVIDGVVYALVTAEIFALLWPQ
jgi:hypothetical protein